MRIVKSCVLRGASYIKTRIWYSIHMMEKAGRETEKLIEELIVQFHMIEHGDVVIAGVSGGADSVCLLLTLCSLREKFGFEVKVCHVNHCLRGAAADADEEYVKKLCGELGVECRVFRKEVELIAEKRKQSCEEAGREVRREAFEQMCAENGVELKLTEGALDFLSQVGYDPEFGARPVKRAIQRYLLNDLSKKLLSQEVDRSKAITVDAGGDGLVFRN